MLMFAHSRKDLQYGCQRWYHITWKPFIQSTAYNIFVWHFLSKDWLNTFLSWVSPVELKPLTVGVVMPLSHREHFIHIHFLAHTCTLCLSGSPRQMKPLEVGSAPRPVSLWTEIPSERRGWTVCRGNQLGSAHGCLLCVEPVYRSWDGT